MKGKIISLILVFVISFSLLSGSYQKKAEASTVVLGYAAFKAGIAFTGFAAYAGMLYANGYHMGIQEMLVGFANKYYDYANGQYIAKGDKISFLDKLNLATSSFLTGNDILSLQDLNDLKESVSESYPSKVNIDDIEIYSEIDTDATKLYRSTFYQSIGGVLIPNEQYKDKIVKLYVKQSYSKHYVYLRVNPIGYSGVDPVVQLLSPQGQVYDIPFSHHLIMNLFASDGLTRVLSRDSSNGVTAEISDIKKEGYIGDVVSTYNSTSNSFSDGTGDFIKAYPNYYSALSGKASTIEDLENLMNTDEYLQREITALIENQAVNTENQLEVPLVDGGVITYPDSVVTDPDVPYVPGASWYDNILDGVTSIPDLFIGKMTDLIDDKITPALESLRDTVLTIPDLISNIWQWILDFPDLLYSWFVPTAPMIAETWDPVMDLWDLKLDPIIAPFKTLTFYESEYQDISVPLKFGSYEKEHKIIDFQYIKSQRDSIKSLIRAFLWILIIFFNLDQIHRLIRNQSLLNTYVRKIDKGA